MSTDPWSRPSADDLRRIQETFDRDVGPNVRAEFTVVNLTNNQFREGPADWARVRVVDLEARYGSGYRDEQGNRYRAVLAFDTGMLTFEGGGLQPVGLSPLENDAGARFFAGRTNCAPTSRTAKTSTTIFRTRMRRGDMVQEVGCSTRRFSSSRSR